MSNRLPSAHARSTPNSGFAKKFFAGPVFHMKRALATPLPGKRRFPENENGGDRAEWRWFGHFFPVCGQ